MKRIFSILIIASVLINACKKDDDKEKEENKTSQSTSGIEIVDIDSTDVFSSVIKVSFAGDLSSVNGIGITLATDSAISQDTRIIYSDSIDDMLTFNVDDLTPNTSYFIKAFVEFADNTIDYSDIKSFNTLEAVVESYTMQKEDYQMIVEYIANHPELYVYLDQIYGNTEYFYGASYLYDNFDMHIQKRRERDPLGLLDGLDDDEVLEELWRRVYEAVDFVLETKYPSAQPIVNGSQVYYWVELDTYEPGSYLYYVIYKVTDAGRFELFKEKKPL